MPRPYLNPADERFHEVVTRLYPWLRRTAARRVSPGAGRASPSSIVERAVMVAKDLPDFADTITTHVKRGFHFLIRRAVLKDVVAAGKSPTGGRGDELDEARHAQPEPEVGLDPALRASLQAALVQLRERYERPARVVELHVLGDALQEDVAKELAMDVRTVRRHLKLARDFMRKRVRAEYLR